MILLDRRNRHPVVVVVEQFFRRDERAVRQHIPNHGRERAVLFSVCVQIIRRRFRDSVIHPLVRRRAVPGGLHFNAILPRWILLVNAAHPRVHREKLADRPVFKAVMLFRAFKVHAAEQARFVAGEAQHVGPRRHERIELMLVAPHTVVRRRAPGHEAHAAGAAHRGGAVTVGKARALHRKSIEMRRAHHVIAVTPQHVRAVLIRQDDEDVGSIGHQTTPHYPTVTSP